MDLGFIIIKKRLHEEEIEGLKRQFYVHLVGKRTRSDHMMLSDAYDDL